MSGVRLLGLLIFLAGLPAAVLAQGAGVAPSGEKGQLHVVVKGDTLWDITAHYLGTPWVWPSIWQENEITNPHRIYPGDLIWITEKSMRKVTPEEAAKLTSSSALPAAAAQPESPAETADAFAALDDDETAGQKVLTYPGLDRFGWLAPEQDSAAAAVLGSHEERYWNSQGQKTIVSLGEGQVNVGDEFQVYRIRRRVLHPKTHKVLGYFTQVLGKVEVIEIHPESSFVRVETSYSEIEPGDRLIPYKPRPRELIEQPVAGHINGMIVAQQPYRLYSAGNDFVVLDRGSVQGIVPGNRFHIFRNGKEVRDPLGGGKVLVPDDVIGSLFVVSVTPTTALALITSAARSIHEGDRFRDL